MRSILPLLAMLIPVPGVAQEGEPPLPRVRPAETDAQAAGSPGVRPAWTLALPADVSAAPLPRVRPDEAGDRKNVALEAPPADGDSQPAEAVEERIYQVACPAQLKGEVDARALPPIAEISGGGQCGAQSLLELAGVLANGRMVPFSGAATTDCGMASALPGWIAAVDSYLAAREKTRIAEVVVGTSYMCRNVNNGSAGNLSFHAFADALDVTGFRLEDGRLVTVAGDWDDALSAEGRLLRYAHGAACAAFTTVLGPEANAQHHDHFHLDLGCHGKTCTSRLCE